jgi:hypothetical protein
MKKILSLILALVMAVGCVFTLASCGAEPELDIDIAAANLSKSGYNAKVDSKVSTEVVKRLIATFGDDEEYLYIWECDSEETAKLMLRECEVMLENEIASLEYDIEYAEEMISEFEEQLSKETINELNKSIEENTEYLEMYKNEMVYGKSGNKVWFGTAAAVEASK